MPRIRKKTKFVAVSSLFNLSAGDVFKYVKKLHEHIKTQNQRINKLRLKLKKMVRIQYTCFAHLDETQELIVDFTC